MWERKASEYECSLLFQLDYKIVIASSSSNTHSLTSLTCHSPDDAEATRSKRAFSSLSWWLVSVQVEVLWGVLYSRTYALLSFWFAGASGTGRTTFVNTLCESEVLAHKVSDNPETAHVEEGIRIKPANVGA